MVDFMVIFDNGGGATLQVSPCGYAHHYDDMEQLAMDVIALADGDDADDWDGHEDAARIPLEHLRDHIDTGGHRVLYRVLSQGDWDQADAGSSWRNVRDYAKSITSLMGLPST